MKLPEQKLQTAKTMFSGALLLAACIVTFWIVANFDVVVKTVRYPEAVRELQVEVTLVSPLAE